MDYILKGFSEAFQYLISFDGEIYSIMGLSLLVSCTATLLAGVLGIGIGVSTGLAKFPFKKLYSRFLYGFMGMPPVVVGLMVAIFISRRGPLGSLEILFTPTAMIVAQVILITPIITGVVFGAVREKGPVIREIGHSLGGQPWDVFVLVCREMKRTLSIALTTGFGRAISEVGAVMIVGGNIKGETRVMTTFIAMNNGMGNYSKSIAMGMVLLLMAMLVNALVHSLSEGSHEN